MNYFRIKQDRSQKNYPELSLVQFPVKRKEVLLEKSDKIPNILPITLMNLKSKVEYIDLLDIQLILFSDLLMKKIQKFETEIIVKDIPLIHPKTSEIQLYKLPIFRFIPCNQEKKQTTTLGLKNKISPDLKIFRTENMQKDMLIINDTLLEKVDFSQLKGILVEPLTIYYPKGVMNENKQFK